LLLGVAASIKIALANLILGAAFVVWLVALARRHARWRTAALYLPVALYGVASVAAVVFSQDPVHSLQELPGVLTLALVPMTISLIDGRRWDRLLLLLTAVAAVSSVVGVWQYLHGASTVEHRLRGLANHYMTFSGWTLLVALLLVGDIAFNRDRKRVVWTVPALLLCVTALALSLTRGTWVGLALGLVVAAALRKPVLLLLYPLLAGALLVVVPRPVLGRAVSILDLDRLGMVKPNYEKYRADDAPRLRVPHLHNNPLQIAAERGLFGLAAYLGILAVFFAQAVAVLRRRGQPQAPPVAGCLLAVLGVTVAGLFEYNWGDAEVWIPTLVCLSAPFALESGERA
jgi:O-antigen ligase